ncbi:phospholipase D/nuclease [Plenodomus tracheiphilus IPT5]|uniref:Phospholipase D/nuclease n=1 Tax=Plenodomus tracheiphilus IPT5 TaxID=1408161 RepID=A0A6A7AW68_9PLEO|nr:phospholipase D/nuclease [Plenodomus tracheiphilus IPT5]
MTSSEATGAPPAKRRKVAEDSPNLEAIPTNNEPSTSLSRPISPPQTKRREAVPAALLTPTWNFDAVPQAVAAAIAPLSPIESQKHAHSKAKQEEGSDVRFTASPIQLTRIKDLGPAQNVDTVGLKDILGDPLIKECWNFNFLFDLDFVMQHFDSDVRDMIKVKIVHGFWKKDDERRIALLETAERYSNIELLSAYIPDPFGTHHSKMLILFRHDDTAQVIIHTANMIQRDWSNMTQAVWTSPLLPVLPQKSPVADADDTVYSIGSGKRFQVDLVQYLAAYERRTKDLIRQLADYDFSAIRAAFIGSAPSRQKLEALDSSKQTAFGWLGLAEILSHVPISSQKDASSSPHMVTQISSIATLGAQPTWLTHFQSVLSRTAGNSKTKTDNKPGTQKGSPLFSKGSLNKRAAPKFSVIFPTSEEIRTSLDGYESGGSIHWKLQSAQQQKQLAYMHPLLCHWKAPATSESHENKQAAHRGPAAPHIKTYICFGDENHRSIDWAMVTSANLSKQAWGDVVNKKNETWIQSYEAGVIVWPALFAESPEESNDASLVMVPVFGKDMPEPGDCPEEMKDENMNESRVVEVATRVVGFRMPYDLPLHPYGAGEKPWCATMKYGEPDWKGLAWGGY